jgi:HD-GYP domain-containing protein (c-di-GMP phosphodiesterase class II)
MITHASAPASTGTAPARDQAHTQDQAIQRAAREFLYAMYGAARNLELYPAENQAVQNALAELDTASRWLLQREAGISLRIVGDVYFLNELRLRLDLGSYAVLGGVARLLRRHGIGELDAKLHAGTADWAAVLGLLTGEPDPRHPFERFVEQLAQRGITAISVGSAREQATQLRDERSPDAARSTYAYSLAVANEVMSGARLGRGMGLRRAKRAVQSIVDQVLNNESSIIGMTVLRDYDEYTFTHSVNVCIFSVALGKRLSLGKNELYELGLGALLHDIGKVRMPVDLINKAGRPTDEEWRMLREHPAEGLLTLFEMHDSAYLPLRAMLVAYEHHMKLDLTGYPSSHRPRRSHLFARIVALADAFDAATSKRSYQFQPQPPDAVLRSLRDNPAFGHDPLLVKAFIGMTGIYPVGMLVVLNSYELAVVIATNPQPEHLHEPIVRVVFDERGRRIDPPQLLDLSERDPHTGKPLRAIIKTTDPERYGIDVAEYFL